MNQGLLYSICWEDPEVIRSVVNEGDDVLCVCSAGDIALTSLLQNPTSCTAVDTNRTQLDLLKFKMAVYDSLPHGRILDLYDNARSNQTEREQILSALECPDALKPEIVKRGMLVAGRFERYLRSFVKYLLPLAVSRKRIAHFLTLESLEKQQEFYVTHIDNRLYQLIFRVFFGKFYMSKKGRHPDLLQYVKEDPAKIFYDRIKHSWAEFPIRNNYFFRLILEGNLHENYQLPIWLEQASIPTIKSRIERVLTINKSILDLDDSDGQAFDVIYLSDVTEVMSRQEAERLFDKCHRLMKSGGRLVVWNNIVDRKPDSKWEYLEDQSLQLWQSRRISLYGYLGIYKKA